MGFNNLSDLFTVMPFCKPYGSIPGWSGLPIPRVAKDVKEFSIGILRSFKEWRFQQAITELRPPHSTSHKEIVYHWA